MDPATVTIATAVAAGAAAGAANVATSAITDAYSGLRRLIVDRYERAAPFAEPVEENPTSQPEQKVLAKQLDQAGASRDEELKAAAQALLNGVEALRSEQHAAALFDFDQLRLAKNLEFEDIETVGSIFRGQGVNIGGDFIVRKVRQKPIAGNEQKN
jgi:hypothetical protein